MERSASRSHLILVSIPRAAVWEFLRTLCQWRHLPEPISRPRHLPVSVAEGVGGRKGGGRAGEEKAKEGDGRGGE